MPAFLVWMPAPRSYTREDMVELHTFGSPVLLATLCDAILTNGARLASPGEFTRRAFLHGRIDLTQAEAVLEVIHAQSESEHRQALEHLRGALHRRIHARKESLIHLSALCEAAIDFSDQDIEVVEGDHVEREIDAALRDVAELLSAARVRPPTGEGVRVAIIGRPNVGKSSLLNCLAGRPVAIVSPHPGTTRDTVEHPLRIEGIEFRLRDSAGIRRPQDPLEAAGIERSQSILESSDLILLVIDGSVPVTEDDCRLAAEADASRTVLVVSKDDLSPVARLDDLPEPMRSRIPCRTSARTGVGIGELRGRMAEAIESGAAAGASPSFLVNARQRGCLLDASRSLASARDAAGAGAGLELIALDLRDALDHLGEVVGEVVTEDILDVIFSRFCIGK